MRSMKGFQISVFLIICLLLAALTSCQSPNKPSVDLPESAAPIESGTPQMSNAFKEAQAIYKKSCIACHGTDLKGRIGDNSNLEHVGKRLDKEQILNQISNGGNGMIAFKKRLSSEEINLLAAWLAAKK